MSMSRRASTRAGHCQCQDSTASSSDWNRLDETIALIDEAREMTEGLRIALPPYLVQNMNKAWAATADSRACLNEFRSCEREAEHHHDIQPTDIHTMGQHGASGYDMNSLSEVSSGFSSRSRTARTSSKAVWPVSCSLLIGTLALLSRLRWAASTSYSVLP